MNTPVSFELAKLLKEKTFPQPKTTFEAQQLGMEFNWYNEDGVRNANYKLDNAIQAPTIADVVTWLYEKHRIWVQPTICSDKTFRVGCIELCNYPLVEHIIRNKNEQLYFNSPTEAYEAAILYTLKNL